MGSIPDSHLDLLTAKSVAYVATVGPKGDPQVTPVWFRNEGTEAIFSLTKKRQKYRNIERDPRVALCISDPTTPYRYLELRGRVQVFDDATHEVLSSLARKYLDLPAYPWHQPGDERVAVRLTTERVTFAAISDEQRKAAPPDRISHPSLQQASAAKGLTATASSQGAASNGGAIPDSHLDLLSAKSVAYVATVGPKGDPQVTPVWFRNEGTEVIFSLTKKRQKYRNIQRDPRVALCISDPTTPYRYLELRGSIQVFDDATHEVLSSLARKYLNLPAYPWHQPGDERVAVRLTTERVTFAAISDEQRKRAPSLNRA